ncbi:hypothetical protein CHUAL_003708 [Chamberlinius hualienensis]
MLLSGKSLLKMSDSVVSSRYFTRAGTGTITSKDAIKNKDKTLEVGKRYSSDDYNIPCVELAKQLLGQTLVRIVRNESSKELQRISGKIVETESYLGGEDKASHSFNGKKTPANEPMFMTPGTAYVYMTYGMYHCFNISSAGEGSAVLIRALEPLEGFDLMKVSRGVKRSDGGSTLKQQQYCNGPSKLCQALQIDKTLNKQDMSTSELLWIEKVEDTPASEGLEIIESSRIGITSRAGEWMMKPLRFYIKGNDNISIRDKKAEQ